MARTPKQAKVNAEAPNPSATDYIAEVYHEIDVGDGGIKRADIGDRVVIIDGEVNVYPPGCGPE
jgi:hypothetical protein